MYCVPYHTWVESAMKFCEVYLNLINKYSSETSIKYGYIPKIYTHTMASVEDEEQHSRNIITTYIDDYLYNLYILFKGTGPEADPYFNEFIIVSHADDFHRKEGLTRKQIVDNADLFFKWLKNTMQMLKPIRVRDTIDLEEYVWYRSRIRLSREYDRGLKRIRIMQKQELMKYKFPNDIVNIILSWL